MSFPKDAQRKGGQNGKPGKHIKTKQWEQLGDFLTDAGAKRAMDILNDLPDDEYLDQFGKLLNYFKPRMQSTQLDANVTERVITGITFDE